MVDYGCRSPLPPTSRSLLSSTVCSCAGFPWCLIQTLSTAPSTRQVSSCSPFPADSVLLCIRLPSAGKERQIALLTRRDLLFLYSFGWLDAYLNHPLIVLGEVLGRRLDQVTIPRTEPVYGSVA